MEPPKFAVEGPEGQTGPKEPIDADKPSNSTIVEEDEDDEEELGYDSSSSSGESEIENYEQCECVDENPKKEDRIPYISVYESSDDAEKRGYFIPSKPVKATITNVDKDETNALHLFNSYLYTLDLEHDVYKWTVKRRYKDFQHLHNRLLVFRTAQKVVAPMRRLRRRRMAIRFDRTLMYNNGDDLREDDESLGGGKVNKALEVSELDPSAVDDGKKRASKGHSPKNLNNKSFEIPSASVIDGNASSNGNAPSNEPQGITVVSSGRLDPIGSSAEAQTRPRRKRPHVHKLPNFPFVPDSMISSENIEVRKDELQRYISRIMHISAYRNHKETALFLDVSRLSFVNNLGAKSMEGLVKKRPGGRKAFQGISRFCIERCAKWSKRWLVVKDGFVAYIHPRTNLIRFVMLYDNDFQVKVGAANLEGIKCGLLLSNLQRELLLRVESDAQALEWKECIDKATSGRGHQWLETHQFGSTFPVRDHSYAHWFVDGRKYMEHLASMLELAKEEIFITDWWLSPEIYLKRPMVEGNRWRLDEILKRKAKAGVRVFVLLYKEVEMALGIKSGYSKQVLQALHPNIRVLRHPDHVPGPTATMLWAHHEKLVVIDQNIAFVSGIDLCYGRWDDHNHKLTDTGSVQYHSKPSMHNFEGKTLISGMKAVAQMLPALTFAEGDVTTISEPDVFESNPPTAATSLSTLVASSAEDVNKRSPNGSGALRFSFENDQQQVPQFTFDVEERRVAKNVLLNGFSWAPKHQVTPVATTPEPIDPVVVARGRSASRGWARARRFMSMPGPSPSSPTTSSPKRGSVEPAPSAPEADRAARFKRLMSTPGGKMDMADVVKKYREYVKSGKVEQEKVKENTPPLQRKQNKVKKILSDWKKRLRHGEEDEGGFGIEDYEEMWSQLQNEAQADAGLSGAGKMWMGKDYVNFIFKDFTDLEMPYHDFIDRALTPRMPWHDIGSVVYGSAARDAARHFIQRWNACKMEKIKYDDAYPYLMPKSYDNVQVPKVFRGISHRSKVQILRSGALWSCGVNHTEDSIHEAYIHMISNAKHYIYIENQFFISLVDSPEVHNRVCKTLCDRIIKAHKLNETFRVYVLMPLLPGFEGQLGTTGGSALQAVLYWTYKSISKGPHSLIGYLAKEIDNYGQYLTFCSLRTHGQLSGRLITELIYIHSKMIIVDDRYCLIGSANINDRSMAGKRDSEMAIYVEDTEFESSKMNGQSYKSGRFSGSIRRHLFREHLGLLDENGKPRKPHKIDVVDPTCDTFWNRWKEIARKNTTIFENVFRCFPTDEVKTFEQLDNYKSQISLVDFNRASAEERLAELQGSLVQFPISFLYNSDLAPSLSTKEGLAPISLFT